MSIEETRILILCDDDPADDGTYVLYWMQQSQRAAHNPALEHAVHLANERGQGLLVGFGLYERYPDANERSFAFLLEGLAETTAALADRKIKLTRIFAAAGFVWLVLLLGLVSKDYLSRDWLRGDLGSLTTGGSTESPSDRVP